MFKMGFTHPPFGSYKDLFVSYGFMLLLYFLKDFFVSTIFLFVPCVLYPHAIFKANGVLLLAESLRSIVSACGPLNLPLV